VARRLSNELEQPLERIETLEHECAAHLGDIDSGVRTLIEHAIEQRHEDPESVEEPDEFFTTVRALAISAQFALGAVGEMITSAEPIEKMS
jgi:hypothetical protein